MEFQSGCNARWYTWSYRLFTFKVGWYLGWHVFKDLKYIFILFQNKTKHTVLPAKSDIDVMLCLKSYKQNMTSLSLLANRTVHLISLELKIDVSFIGFFFRIKQMMKINKLC